MSDRLVTANESRNYTVTLDAISQRQQNSKRNQRRKAMERLLELMNLKTNDQLLLNQIVNMLNQVFDFEHILEIYKEDFDEYTRVHPLISVKNDEISMLKEKCNHFELKSKSTRNKINRLKESIVSLEEKSSRLQHKLLAQQVSDTRDGAESICSVRSSLKIENNK